MSERERRPLSFARWGAALVAVLAGDAVGRTALATSVDGPSGAVLSVAASYAQPAAPGAAFRLRVDAPKDSAVVLLITRGPALESEPRHITAEELASAVVVPVPLDAAGILDFSALAPSGLSLDALREARLRFRLAITIPEFPAPLITDPIPVVDARTGTTFEPLADSSFASHADTVTSANSLGTVSQLGTATGSTTDATPSTTESSSSPSTMTDSATTSYGSTSTSSSVSKTGTENETDSATAPPTASKASVQPTSSIPVPVPTNLAARLLTQFTLVSATHDQPSPIQGSGH